ncbi:membrane protein insertion efficiency factor YidD [Helicobacter mustelae]|uniref:membrane protein insertion efficiency factor YidD n=1 Tax=Helicobacter mustelae TaxID=217 RepID=UPI000E0F517C|nr:membrane protein insertion efficiency factor YidD [Helicobacter mustelae]
MYKFFFQTTRFLAARVPLWLIEKYQRFLSPLFPGTCRYYPGCSEYAAWSFKNQHFLPAIWSILWRILRCNQLFLGGIDYPVVQKRLRPDTFAPCKIAFWFVPLKKSQKKFFIIKSIL